MHSFVHPSEDILPTYNHLPSAEGLHCFSMNNKVTDRYEGIAAPLSNVVLKLRHLHYVGKAYKIS